MKYVLLLALILTPLAHADCEIALGGEPAKVQLIFNQLRALGMTALLRDVDKGLAVEYRPKRTRFQSDVTWKSRFGKKTLIVRRLPWSTATDRQRSTWAVAKVLYQMQLDRTMMSWIRLVPRPDKKQLKAELTELAAKLGVSGRDRGHVDRYIKWVERTAVLTVLLAGVEAVAIPDPPNVYEAREAVQVETDMTEASVRGLVIGWRNRLATGIEFLEKDPSADQEELASLRKDLADLYEQYPYLLCIPVGDTVIRGECG